MIDLSDFNAANDLLARYCWALDHGDTGAYGALFAEEGVLTGFGDPIHGRSALRGMLASISDQSKGKWRHHLTSQVFSYVDGKDRVEAKGYQLITNWSAVPPVLDMMVEARWVLVRAGDGWEIVSLDLEFIGPEADPRQRQ